MAKAMAGPMLVDIVVAEAAMTCASRIGDLARRGSVEFSMKSITLLLWNVEMSQYAATTSVGRLLLLLCLRQRRDNIGDVHMVLIECRLYYNGISHMLDMLEVYI